MNVFERLLRRQYRKVRRHDLDPEVSLFDLASLAVRKGLDLCRGSVARSSFRRCGPNLFLARGVEFRSRRKIVLGRDVVLNRGARIDAYGLKGISVGDRVTVAEGARLLVSGVVREPGVGIKLEADVAIGMDCLLWGQGGIRVGAGTLVGPGVMIFSENHVTEDLSLPIRDQGTSRALVTIGDGCWIGAGSVILAGVTLGAGTVVAAGAVVTRSTLAGSTVGGVPARQITDRGRS